MQSHLGFDNFPTVGIRVVIDVILGDWHSDRMFRDVQAVQDDRNVLGYLSNEAIVVVLQLFADFSRDPAFKQIGSHISQNNLPCK